MDLHDWTSDRRIWLPLLLLGWGMAFLVRDPFMTDWDSYDYAAAVVQGVPSALGLGRALFLAYNRVLWLLVHHACGLPPQDAYLVIKYGVIIQSGPTLIGLYALYKELTANRQAALLATLLLALSPLFIVYSGRGMSEIPGLLCLSWSLWWLLRSLRARRTVQYLLASVLFGLSANVREYALFYLPVIFIAGWLWSQQWQISALALLLAGLAVIAGPLFWSLYWPDYYLPALRSWYSLSAQERLEHPVTLRNLWLLFGYAFLCSSAATLLTPFAVRAGWQKWLKAENRLRQSLLLLFAFCGLVAIAVLPANHDLAVNPRYLLTGLVGIAPLCGWWLAEWIKQKHRWRLPVMSSLAGLTLIGLIGMFVYLHRVQWPLTYAARGYAEKILPLPDNSVFITGRRTPLVNFYARIGAHSYWQTIPFGAGWPDEGIREVIDSYLREDRAVYVDFDEKLWFEGMRAHSREAEGLAIIGEEYYLELVSDTLYRIVGRKR